MKILLCTQVPNHFQTIKKTKHVIPEFQAQSFWIKGIKDLGHKVDVFLYTNPVIGSVSFWSNFATTIEKSMPLVFSKYRKVRNKYYRYFPDNIIRSGKLEKKIQSYEPDIVIFSGGISELGRITSDIYKNSNKILLHGVNPQEGATQFEIDHVKFFDSIVVNDPTHAQKWLDLGARKAYALPYSGIHQDCHRDKKLERTIDVLFVGTLFKERHSILIQLVESGINLKIYGHVPRGVKLPIKLNTYYCGESWGNEMITLFNRSKIVINLVPDHMPVGGNLRTFEIPGCGALQIVNRCPEEWFKDTKEIIVFGSVDDLIEKINYYLINNSNREKIAKAGYRRTQKEYIYKERFKTIFKR